MKKISDISFLEWELKWKYWFEVRDVNRIVWDIEKVKLDPRYKIHFDSLHLDLSWNSILKWISDWHIKFKL